MLQHTSHTNTSEQSQKPFHERSGVGSLQWLLWAAWTLAVVATGYVQWQRALIAHRTINLLGLVIHASTVGVIGLIILTVIEMRLEPWRFLD